MLLHLLAVCSQFGGASNGFLEVKKENKIVVQDKLSCVSVKGELAMQTHSAQRTPFAPCPLKAVERNFQNNLDLFQCAPGQIFHYSRDRARLNIDLDIRFNSLSY